MTAPLTPAEQAAARVMESIFGTGSGDGADEAFIAEVRAVVAAVRSQIEADALREAATEMRGRVDFQSLSADHQSGVVLAVGELHRRAAALSRPTSEETDR